MSVEYIVDHPKIVLLIAFVVMWLAGWLGARFSARFQGLREDVRPDFGVILGAVLTLLGLIIGFSFSMAVTRYDLRKNYEEAEANAIGTEYVRADLLPEPNASQVRTLLKQYTDLRIQYYQTRDRDELGRIDADTARVQGELWTTASGPAMAQPNPVAALAVAGMNDVLNSQGYTQAAWWNRIPGGAWLLMFAIAVFCNAMLGYEAKRYDLRLFTVLPLVIAVSFFLISDIDSPRRGMIRVHPQNLISLRAGLK